MFSIDKSNETEGVASSSKKVLFVVTPLRFCREACDDALETVRNCVQNFDSAIIWDFTELRDLKFI
jgi:hypothetical protein